MKRKVEVDFVEGEGEDKIEFHGEVTLKRLNFSEKNMLEEEATDIKIFGNVPQVKVSPSKLMEVSILRTVVENGLRKTTYHVDKKSKELIAQVIEYDLNIDNIRKLPIEVGNLLFTEFTIINNLQQKKNEI